MGRADDRHDGGIFLRGAKRYVVVREAAVLGPAEQDDVAAGVHVEHVVLDDRVAHRRILVSAGDRHDALLFGRRLQHGVAVVLDPHMFHEAVLQDVVFHAFGAL